MFERRPPVVHSPSVIVNGNRLRSQNCAASALCADVVQIGGQPVANIDHGVDRHEFIQLDGLEDTWRKLEMPAENTAADGAGDHDPVARPRAAT